VHVARNARERKRPRLSLVYDYDSPGEAAAKLMSTQAEMLATLREAGHVMRALCAMVSR
jgi:hypothetical protein